MAADETLQGRRYDDVPDAFERHERMEAGGYRRSRSGDDAPWKWEICDPLGHVGTIGNHTVEEHEDGTITVSPSILDAVEGGWHGYLEHGVWRKV